jgi:hypothetical protein
MATTGTATISFGAQPGGRTAQVAVTGQAGIGASSRVEAWIEVPAGGSADHSADEHWLEDIQVYAGNISAGVGFTIYAKCMTGSTYGAFTVAWVWT